MSDEDRVRVTKRVTLKLGDDYASCEIAVERSRPSGVSVGDAITGIETEVDAALDRFRRDTQGVAGMSTPTASATGTGPVASPRVPEAGWTPFKSGKGAWIRTEDAGELGVFLAKCDRKLAVVAGYLYKLSGDNDQFVNRFVHQGGSEK